MHLDRSHRLATFQTHLQPHQLALIATPTHIHYLTGFGFLVPEEREAFLLISKTSATLAYPHFSPLPPDLVYEVVPGISPASLGKHVQKILAAQSELTEVLVDVQRLYTEEYLEITHIGSLTVTPMPVQWLTEQRAVKDSYEINCIRRASDIAAQAFAELLPQIKVGVTERELQHQLDELMKKHGSLQPAFPTIVAFGDHAALPHHQPSDTALQDNTGILIDFGATYEGYRSDMTRSWWFGTTPTPEFSELSTLVQQAYDAVITLLKQRLLAGQEVRAKDIDKAARSIIDEAGFAREFIHTTGHGVGLDIHEFPSLHAHNDEVIKPGMVITVEPGIYLPEKCGFRYENTVLLTKTGVEELTLK